MVQILQIAVPLADAVTIAALPAAQQNDAQNRLEIMKDIVAALPAGQEDRIGDGLPERAGRLTTAPGAALRAIRAIIFENDPLHAFGGLRRVQAPGGDLLWVCRHHYPDYDPGLPIVR